MDLTYELQKNGKEQLAELFELYVKEMRYLRNFSEFTLEIYKDTFKRWQKHVGAIPTKANLNQFVIGMRESGLGVTTCNISIRATNAFLTWLKEKEVITEPLRLKKLPEEHKKMRVFPDKDLQALLAFKPSTHNEHRIYALVSLLIDTGIRINECLTIESNRVDFENLLITVKGKGKKERIVPMSLELRKTLHRYYTRHRKPKFESPHFFCTVNGTQFNYRNAYRDLENVFDKVKIDKANIDGFFHMFRRKFARSYIKNGGNMFYLQHAMGHSTLTMTKHYVEVEDEELKGMHMKTSLLSRLKS